MQPSGEHPGKADVDSNSYVRASPPAQRPNLQQEGCGQPTLVAAEMIEGSVKNLGRYAAS